jgi:hypothetical protein
VPLRQKNLARYTLDYDWFLHWFRIILLQVDGDTSTNDTVIALASGLSGLSSISSLNSDEAIQLQACVDAVSLILYNSITILSSHSFFPVEWNNKWYTSALVGSLVVLVKLINEVLWPLYWRQCYSPILDYIFCNVQEVAYA